MDAHDKRRRRMAVIAAMHRVLLPLPCGCIPSMAPCDCPDTHCECELELEFCDCVDEWSECEAFAFVERLGTFYSEVDPAHYAEPPTPVKPIITIARDKQIDRMAARVESGVGLRHHRDLHPAATKNGEGCEVGHNGAAKRVGAAAEPERTFRATFRSTAKGHTKTD